MFRGAVVAAIATTVAALTVVPAAAHEDVPVGDLALVIGFGTEPAYSGQPNSAQVIVTRGGETVTDLRPGDLEVEVTSGDATTTLDLEPNFAVGAFGEPGDYRAWFVPSLPGTYTFRITGRVDGEEIDETVRSGPQTFSDVIDVAEATFPPVDAPTNEELATRVERESRRAGEAVAAAELAASAAADDASTARTVALIAFVVGAIGVIAGIAGIASGRGRSRT